MIINGNTIRCKSLPCFYMKEKAGVKTNTVRGLLAKDLGDPSFLKDVKIIEIENTSSKEVFSRTISDISFWSNYVIVSWRHE